MKALHYSNIYMNNQELSEQAEIFVANVLQQYNWQTIAHRYRDIVCELDLVAKKSLIIVKKLRKNFIMTYQKWRLFTLNLKLFEEGLSLF